ncbi:MAG: FAD-dependent oxidoreductase [Deltaproteobacteria bacterium]|nr:FAD-dependent oxidoreductase [Deltaproteobacteria bacterium]MBT4640532.1 FAD-dependent oxidoreductase [Deltaproteobacteria bacterium]MBT6499156.1 FAD-dependent oxidoreductase [Deltaproteobacteria bacterium]MBT7713973.1 FAD-dependent oxidoreductase [Deltaproteobacteria bacterium]
MSEKRLTEPERKTLVEYDVDVAVVGGGTAGCVAAIAAARTGASTVLIERFGSLGGCPTVGRCAHIGNRFIDSQMRRVIDGIPVEIMTRIVNEGGTNFPTLEETIYGKTAPPVHILVDPEIMAVVLMEMVEEAGVKLMLHTYFCDPVMEGDQIKGVVVQNKSGRKAVLAKTVVDASGEADVAFSAGVPCSSNPEAPTIASSYGLLLRMGNVDQERFMEYVLNLPVGQPDPDFAEWLSKHVDSPLEELKKHAYWKFFLDPQPVDEGMPRNHPGKARLSSESMEWYREKWVADREFAFVEMHLFRHKIREAVENGDLELFRPVGETGMIAFNFDGVTGGMWRQREVIVNAVTAIGFDAFDSDQISKVEVASRRRALEVSRFMKKYIPGFENAYIVDTGAQTMPRHIRIIEAENSLNQSHRQSIDGQDETAFVATYGHIPGIAHKIPYGMMVPKRIGNLLVAGKSADGAIKVRDIPDMMNMGQAAGTAAALSSQKGISPGQLDIKELQKVLKEQHVILDIPAA